jgi:hypothetical protein
MALSDVVLVNSVVRRAPQFLPGYGYGQWPSLGIIDMETVSAREVVGNLGVDVVLGLLGAGPVTWNVRLGRTELGSMSVVTVVRRVVVLVVVLYSFSSSGVSSYGRSKFAFAL